MARLPSSILKQLTARAKETKERMLSTEGSAPEHHVLLKANENTGNYYLMYDDVIRTFLIAGYSESSAEKYINYWKDYDFADTLYLDRYKLIGFDLREIERAMR